MSIRIPSVEIRASGKAATPTDTTFVLVSQDRGGKPLGDFGAYKETVKRLESSAAFKGAAKSVQFIRFGGRGGADHVLFAGAGKLDSITGESMRRLGGTVGGKIKAEKVKALGIDVASFRAGLRGLKSIDWKEALEALVEGILLSLYPINAYKSDKTKPEPLARIVLVPGAERTAVSEMISRLRAVTETMYLARDWSNEPSNIGTPEFYASEARKIATKARLKVRVLGEREAKTEKMGLLLGVSQGSAREAKIVIAEYRPKRVTAKTRTIAFVGKGVTFDSGGISIKPSAKMEDMKHDMSGASTAFGALLLAARLEVPNRVIAILGFTENMPGGKALNPGAVITGRSGKTVEIINTDAEGRLVLADILDYVQDSKPDVVIDIATLTGAIGYAIGNQCCGLFVNDSDLAESLKSVGEENGERMAEMPMFDDYLEHLKSDYADLKNCTPGTQGGAVTAAMFLKQFIRKGVRWAHLDIAYTAWDLGHVTYHPKRGATGAYVRTLARFAQQFS